MLYFLIHILKKLKLYKNRKISFTLNEMGNIIFYRLRIPTYSIKRRHSYGILQQKRILRRNHVVCLTASISSVLDIIYGHTWIEYTRIFSTWPSRDTGRRWKLKVYLAYTVLSPVGMYSILEYIKHEKVCYGKKKQCLIYSVIRYLVSQDLQQTLFKQKNMYCMR